MCRFDTSFQQAGPDSVQSLCVSVRSVMKQRTYLSGMRTDYFLINSEVLCLWLFSVKLWALDWIAASGGLSLIDHIQPAFFSMYLNSSSSATALQPFIRSI